MKKTTLSRILAIGLLIFQIVFSNQPLQAQLVLVGDPTANPDSAQTIPNKAVLLNVLRNDFDPGYDVLYPEVVTPPAHGQVSTADSYNRLTYTPAAGYSGNDSFTYRAINRSGLFSPPATVTLQVSSNNLFTKTTKLQVRWRDNTDWRNNGKVYGPHNNTVAYNVSRVPVSFAQPPQILNWTATPLTSPTGGSGLPPPSKTLNALEADGQGGGAALNVQAVAAEQTVKAGVAVVFRFDIDNAIPLDQLQFWTVPPRNVLPQSYSEKIGEGADFKIQFTPDSIFRGKDALAVVVFDNTGHSTKLIIPLNVTNATVPAPAGSAPLLTINPLVLPYRYPPQATVATVSGTPIPLNFSFHQPQPNLRRGDFVQSVAGQGSGSYTPLLNQFGADMVVVEGVASGNQRALGFLDITIGDPPVNQRLLLNPPAGRVLANGADYGDGIFNNIDFNGLEGEQLLGIDAQDGAGGGAGQDQDALVDTTPPSIQLVQPINDQCLSGPLIFNGQAVDELVIPNDPGSARVIQVDYRIDSGSFDLTEGPFGGNYNPFVYYLNYTNAASLQEGNRTFEFQAVDRAFNPARTNVTLRKDLLPPSVRLLINGNVVALPATVPVNIVDQAAIQIEATEPALGCGVSDIKLFIDANPVIPTNAPVLTSNTSPLSFTWKTKETNVVAGDHLLYLVAKDRGGNASIISVPVSVTNTPANNLVPTAVNDSITLAEDVVTLINVLSNDTDPENDALTISNVTGASKASLAIINNQVRYTPNANANGSDTFSYTASDSRGGTDTAQVTVTITPVNDPPVGLPDSVATNEDTAVLINVLANDSDLDGDTLRISGVTQGSKGPVVVRSNLSPPQLEYTPAANVSGTDSLSYVLADGAGGIVSVLVSVTINAVNDVPLAGADTATTNEDTKVLIPVLNNDSDSDGDTLTLASVAQPSKGRTLIRTDLSPRQIEYTPNTNANGNDSFTYTVNDGKGGSASAQVGVTIRPVNDNPVANADTTSTDAGVAVLIPVLSNDSDLDGDTLTLASVAQPSKGSTTIRTDLSPRQIEYTPTNNATGLDTFTYNLSDNNGGTAVGTVNVAIRTQVNNAPTCSDFTELLVEDTTKLINVISHVNDPDGDPLFVTSLFFPTHGTTSIQNNQIKFIPEENYSGEASLRYVASDGDAGCTGEIVLDIAAINDAPSAGDDFASTNRGQAVLINVLQNDSDIEGDSLAIQSVSTPAKGSARILNAQVEYTANTTASGTDSFTYTLSDGKGGTDIGTVNVTIQAQNTAPVCSNFSVQTNEDTPITVNVLSHVTDAEGDTISLASVFFSELGESIIEPDQRVRYIPTANIAGEGKFIFWASDGQVNCPGVVTVTIQPVNDLPIANLDDVFTVGSQSKIIDVLANDTDVDGDILSVTSVARPAHGIAVIDNNQVRYQAENNFGGVDSFTYQISDNKGGSATGTIRVTVAAAIVDSFIQDFRPANNSTVSGLVPISVTVEDPLLVLRVEIYLDQKATPDWLFFSDPFVRSWNTTLVPNGAHTLRAVVLERDGNLSEQTNTITVQNVLVPPTVTIDYPVSGKEYLDLIQIRTHTTGPTIAAVEFRLDGQLLPSGNTTSDVVNGRYTYNWRIGDTPISEGSHVIEATAINSSGLTDKESVSFYIDKTKPVVNFVKPAPSSTSPPIVFRRQTFEVQASDTRTLNRVELRLNGTCLIANIPGTVATKEYLFNSQGSYCGGAPLEDGNYTMVARAIDNAGNIKDATLPFIINNTNPPRASTVVTAFPADGSFVLIDPQIYFTFGDPLNTSTISQGTVVVDVLKDGISTRLNGQVSYDTDSGRLNFLHDPIPVNSRVTVNLVSLQNSNGEFLDGQTIWTRAMDKNLEGVIKSGDGMLEMSIPAGCLPENGYVALTMDLNQELGKEIATVTGKENRVAGPYLASAMTMTGNAINSLSCAGKLTYTELNPPQAEEIGRFISLLGLENGRFIRIASNLNQGQAPQSQADPVAVRSVSAPIIRMTSFMVTSFDAPPLSGIAGLFSYPNPFDPVHQQATLQYSLASDSDVTILIYDLFGGLVKKIEYGAGTNGGRIAQNQVVWDGRNGEGVVVANGGYIIQILVKDSDGKEHKARYKVGVLK